MSDQLKSEDVFFVALSMRRKKIVHVLQKSSKLVREAFSLARGTQGAKGTNPCSI